MPEKLFTEEDKSNALNEDEMKEIDLKFNKDEIESTIRSYLKNISDEFIREKASDNINSSHELIDSMEWSKEGCDPESYSAKLVNQIDIRFGKQYLKTFAEDRVDDSSLKKKIRNIFYNLP